MKINRKTLLNIAIATIVSTATMTAVYAHGGYSGKQDGMANPDQMMGNMQGQGQMMGDMQGQGQMMGDKQGHGQMMGNMQGQGQMMGDKHGQGQMMGNMQGHGQMMGNMQGHRQMMGNMQGHGQMMGNMQGQGKMMGNMQGHGQMMDGTSRAFMQENLDGYKQVLGITTEQEDLWVNFVNAVKGNMNAMAEMQSNVKAEKPIGFMTHFDQLKMRAKQMEGVATAANALYEELTPEQQETADRHASVNTAL